MGTSLRWCDEVLAGSGRVALWVEPRNVAIATRKVTLKTHLNRVADGAITPPKFTMKRPNV